MLPDPEDREIPDVEDVHADDDQGEAGHDEPASDAVEGGEDDGDKGGRAVDDGEDDLAGADEGQEGRSPQVGRQPGRGETRFQRLSERTRVAEERTRQLEADMAALRNNSGQPRRSAEEIAAERRARLELMGPDEKTEFLLGEQRQQMESRFGQLEWQMRDSADRTRYDALCSTDSVARKYRDEVEAARNNLIRTGQGAPDREAILNYLVGQKARQAASQGGNKDQRQQAQRRVQRQAARPGTSGSDRQASDERRGGDERSKRAKRLDGINI